MRSAVSGVGAVGEGEDQLAVAVVVLQGHVHPVPVDPLAHRDDAGADHLLVPVQMPHQAGDSPFKVEHQLLVGPLVADAYLQLGLQVGQFAQMLSQEIEVVVQVTEDAHIGDEGHRASGVISLAVGLDRTLGHAAEVFLTVADAAPLALHPHPAGQGVDHCGTHAVQSTGDAICLPPELGPGVEHGHDRLQRRSAGVGVSLHRDAPAVVFHPDSAASAECQLHPVAVPGNSLINAVVDDFEDEVMESPVVRAPDIHTGAAADCLQPLQNTDVFSGVAVVDFWSPLVLHALGAIISCFWHE